MRVVVVFNFDFFSFTRYKYRTMSAFESIPASELAEQSASDNSAARDTRSNQWIIGIAVVVLLVVIGGWVVVRDKPPVVSVPQEPSNVPLAQATGDAVVPQPNTGDAVIAVQPTPDGPAYTLLGVYQDVADDRNLPNGVRIGAGPREYDIEQCYATAKDAGAKYFSQQDGNECRWGPAGTDYSKHGPAVWGGIYGSGWMDKIYEINR